MFATLKADLAAVEAYVVAHYKQLGVAVLVGKFSAAIVAAVTALAHAL
jgi:hypothetical protein